MGSLFLFVVFRTHMGSRYLMQLGLASSGVFLKLSAVRFSLDAPIGRACPSTNLVTTSEQDITGGGREESYSSDS